MVGSIIVGVLVGIIAIGWYMLPTLIAKRRHMINIGSIAVVNIFLGWTLVGWVVALAMAVRTRPQQFVS